MKHTNLAYPACKPAKEAKSIVCAPIPPNMTRRFQIFANELSRWRKATNLTSKNAHSDLWTRHIRDSMQLLPLAPNAKRWLDIGSGAGFPGLVIAIQLCDEPGAEVHCVESDKRKCAFLANVVRQTGIPAFIHAIRIEQLDATSIMPIDAVTTRALTSLPRTLTITKRYLDTGATGLFPLGSGSRGPLQPEWSETYVFEKINSKTDPNSCILRVQKQMV